MLAASAFEGIVVSKRLGVYWNEQCRNWLIVRNPAYEYLWGRSMAFLAESLVEEWLNRNRFFTIRGIKHGLAEMDLLAIRHEAETSVIGWHVEVQVSFRPVTYIAKLTDDLARALNRIPTNAAARTPDQIETCASQWVQSKFKADAKAKAREGLWPHVQWEYHLVHARVSKGGRDVSLVPPIARRFAASQGSLLFRLGRRRSGRDRQLL
jgi:hypothetical protein